MTLTIDKGTQSMGLGQCANPHMGMIHKLLNMQMDWRQFSHSLNALVGEVLKAPIIQQEACLCMDFRLDMAFLLGRPL